MIHYLLSSLSWSLLGYLFGLLTAFYIGSKKYGDKV